ncbi:MAG: S-layer homology domain-containing protein [bacterium]|nr:S-layer homology domain-containing protein [bacterium]MDE0601855.1 S-layer homology domain-containing protein [bacterium]
MNTLGTNQTLLTNNRTSDLMPSWSPDGSQIVFQSDRDGDLEIFTMDADGANVRQLTHNTISDTSPTWSPDGEHIAFSSGGRARIAILVMDADGSDPKRLTTIGDFRDEWPSWSPDGASILFTRSGQFFQVKADGTDLRQVTGSDGLHGISTSSWSSQGVLLGSDLFLDLPVGHWADVATGWVVSNGIVPPTGSSTLDPDGALTRADMVTYLHRALAILPNSPVQQPGYDGVIVFTSHRDGWNQIEAIDADGANHRPITYTASRDASASWSPDGSQIAFQSDRDGDFEIFAVGVDGTQLRQITNNEVDDWAPVWSPDGSRIAYMSRRRGTDGIRYRQVMVMNSDGTGQRQLTTTNRSSQSPSWSPDGTRIAFALSRRVSPGSQGIYYQLMTVDPNGTNLRPVTSEDYSAFSPSWSPDGAKIAFTGRPRDGGYYQIHVINPDGTGQRQLTDTDRDNFSSSWSPDGTHIAFASERDGHPEIYIMRADGSEPRRLTNSTRSIPSDQAWWAGTTYAGSEVFTDVPMGHPADQAIGWALSSGVTTGVGEDLFDPEGTVTRAQMVTFLHRAAMLVED